MKAYQLTLGIDENSIRIREFDGPRQSAAMISRRAGITVD